MLFVAQVLGVDLTIERQIILVRNSIGGFGILIGADRILDGSHDGDVGCDVVTAVVVEGHVQRWSVSPVEPG